MRRSIHGREASRVRFFHNLTILELILFLTAVPVEIQWRHCCRLSWQWFVLCLPLRLHQGIWFSGSGNYYCLLTTSFRPRAGCGFFVSHLIGCFCCPHTNLGCLGHAFWLSWVRTSSQKQFTVAVSWPANFFLCPPAFLPYQVPLQFSSQNLASGSFSSFKQPLSLNIWAGGPYSLFSEMFWNLSSKCPVSTCNSASELPPWPVQRLGYC